MFVNSTWFRGTKSCVTARGIPGILWIYSIIPCSGFCAWTPGPLCLTLVFWSFPCRSSSGETSCTVPAGCTWRTCTRVLRWQSAGSTDLDTCSWSYWRILCTCTEKLWKKWSTTENVSKELPQKINGCMFWKHVPTQTQTPIIRSTRIILYLETRIPFSQEFQRSEC